MSVTKYKKFLSENFEYLKNIEIVMYEKNNFIKILN